MYKKRFLYSILAVVLSGSVLCSCGQAAPDASTKPQTAEAADSSTPAMTEVETPLVPAEISSLTVNYMEEPLCVDDAPLFSWKMYGSKQGLAQSAYRLLVALSDEDLASENYIWDSGKITSDLSVAIPYEGEALASATSYAWTVCVWDQNDQLVNTSMNGHFGTGLSKEDWQGAKWIYAPTTKENSEDAPFEGTISYKACVPESHSGFFWGADDSYYGDYYRLALNTIEDAVEIQFANMHYETIVEEHIVALEVADPSAWENTFHDIALDISLTDVAVLVDGTNIGTFSLTQARPIGSIGFWTTRGIYYGYYDDFTVIESNKPDSSFLYSEDFEQESETIFSPYFCKISEPVYDLEAGHCMCADSGFTITADSMEPAPLFRKEFQVASDKKVTKALLHASALGSYDLYVNASSVDGSFFGPGQSQYDKEVYYRSFDITPFMTAGTNIFAATLGHGRYDRAKASWGDDTALLALLQIEYEDGTVDYVPTDDSFLCYTDGPVRNDDLYAGEFYDMNKEVANWYGLDCDTSSWTQATLHPFTGKQKEPELIAAVAPANSSLESLSPVSVTEPKPGVYVCDFGDNITGICELTFQGTAGTPVMLRYAEKLNEEDFAGSDDIPGTIWTKGLFTARNTDYCVPASGETTCFMPRLVYRGFRYVEITGTAAPVTADQIVAHVITSDNSQTGTFSCSDDSINRLYQAIYRTQKNNYVDIPTDCPQRDERFGWAGDAQVFARTASYNANVHNFLESYLRTFVRAQRDNGAFPDLLTSAYDNGGSNGWADAGIILTWELYQQYGDRAVILDHLEEMCLYADYLIETSDDYIRTMDSYSDHIAESMMSDDMCNTAECVYVTNLLAKMCRVAGEEALAEKYEKECDSFRIAWQEHYLNEDGSVGNWMQSEYVLPLAFEIYPEELARTGADFLNISVESGGFHVNTGYVSTPWILPVLCKYGYTDSAYKLIMQNEFPSWNYMFSHGNTTLTESFHTYHDNEDGTYSINGSLNHFALGSVGSWLYSDVLGIKRDEAAPGYKHFYLEPRISNNLSYAQGSYDSVYGLIESSWSLNGNELTYRCTIPANTSATLVLPGLTAAGVAGEDTPDTLELEAGTYEFHVTFE